MAEFKVLRRHEGDKDYFEGDTREANPGDVQHLVDAGVLKPIKAKAEPEVENKAEGASPEDKAEAPPASKAKPKGAKA